MAAYTIYFSDSLARLYQPVYIKNMLVIVRFKLAQSELPATIGVERRIQLVWFHHATNNGTFICAIGSKLPSLPKKREMINPKRGMINPKRGKINSKRVMINPKEDDQPQKGGGVLYQS